MSILVVIAFHKMHWTAENF